MGGGRPPRSWRDSQLVQLTLVRFREFIREPEAVFWVFAFPILMAAGLGIAFRSRGADVFQVAAVERPVPGHLEFATILAKARDISVHVMPRDSALSALRAGKVALVVIDAGAGNLDYRYDPAREESRSARLLFNDVLQRALGRVDPLAAVDNVVTDRGSRYIDFVVPGLLGMNLMGSGVWGLGFVLVDMRRKKLLKRLVATPMSRSKFLASFLLSRLVLLVLEVVALIGFSVLAFQVPLTGPLWVLAVVCVLGALCFGGLGLLISSRVRTLEGASGLMNAAMLPMWILSGVFFSSSHFPAIMQPFVHALPLTAVNDALRANMLEGASLAGIWPELAIILAWMTGCFALAFRLFRWK
jgi:ABC-type multidrug transport system permease subunit